MVGSVPLSARVLAAAFAAPFAEPFVDSLSAAGCDAD
jgi:hypothetical protein